MKNPPVKHLLQLFQQGYCRAEPALNALLPGLAHPDSDENNTGWTISRQLLSIRHLLATSEEAVAAVLALDTSIREAWLAVMAARTREAAKLSNPEALVQLVTRLGPVAHWVAQQIEQTAEPTRLSATSINTLERQLFNAGAEQNQSLPALTRVLAAAAQLAQWQAQKQALPAMPTIPTVEADQQNPEQNWCKGRLLALPECSDTTSATLLTGTTLASGKQSNMDWACTTPWGFLLTTLVYAQDSWAAEQRGGLLLELPAGQQPTHPGEIQVLVEDADGYEVLCGTLAELILRVLGSLNIALFPRTPNSNELNGLLSPVIHQLLAQQIWDYHEGLSGEQGYYRIHHAFADDCYKITGSKIFGRRGRILWQAFRIQAEQWRRETFSQQAAMRDKPRGDALYKEPAHKEAVNKEAGSGKTGVSV